MPSEFLYLDLKLKILCRFLTERTLKWAICAAEPELSLLFFLPV